ncbi:hypothetical protein IQ07DRAFT_202840 [Pyrenochaeta sp. DS3sAY3a]|nr:hypothetical protein IQ07DRAFT_202840 [Pyrenochaeta sp. DS3sAY3a]
MASNTDIATCALVITLKAVPLIRSADICALTGILVHTVNSIYARAIQRGFNPAKRLI